MSSEPTHEADNAATREFWNHSHTAGSNEGNFLNHPVVQNYLALRSSGTNAQQLEVVIAEVKARTAPGDRILSVGVGPASKEIAIAGLIPDRIFVGLDLAEQALRKGREAARAAGVTNLELIPGDFNALDLEPKTYRAILGLGAIHHVEALEDFWAACRSALIEDGVVMAQEYIGPNRFQWTDAQFEAADRALQTLPDRFKPHHQRAYRMDPDRLAKVDPSEAVRSADILPTLRAADYEVLGFAGAGCALLQPVLMEQIQAFDATDWSHNLKLAELFAEEDRLMREGVLRDDFCGFIAKP
ncbi:MAG: class I SAM-dependent methyltransferase [Planctomycetota bacterium]